MLEILYLHEYTFSALILHPVNSPCGQHSVAICIALSMTCQVKVKIAQSCLTLCDLMDYTVHGIIQARILKWVTFPFSMGSSQTKDQTQVSHIAGGFFTS